MGLGQVGLELFGSDKPDLKKQVIVKNEAIQDQINRGIAANADTQKFNEDAITRFLTRFNNQTPQAEDWTRQGIGVYDDIYSGALEQRLGSLRQGERAARELGLERALRLARGRDAAYAARTGLPGQSSYRDLMEARLYRDATTDAELADAAQKRADFNAVLNSQMQNVGSRQALADALMNREVIPSAVMQQLRSAPLSTLGALTKLDQDNNWYNLYKQRTAAQKFAAADQEMLNTIGQVASIYSSVMGGGMMGGGGAVRPPSPQAQSAPIPANYSGMTNPGWSPSGPSYPQPTPGSGNMIPSY